MISNVVLAGQGICPVLHSLFHTVQLRSKGIRISTLPYHQPYPNIPQAEQRTLQAFQFEGGALQMAASNGSAKEEDNKPGFEYCKL